MRLVTFLLALVMGVGALGLGDSAATAGTPPRQAAHAKTSGIVFTAAPAAAGVLKPGEDLLISGVISNGTPAAIAPGTVSVYLDRSVVSSRDELSDWLAKGDDSGTHATAELFQGTSPAVPAGETRAVYLTVPAAAIGLDPSTSVWGARALSVRITDGDSEVAVAHSSVVWYPGGSFTPIALALAVPIGVPAGTSGLIGADALATYTGPNGILTHELDQAVSRRVALAVDPMLIASITILGTSAPASALEWLARLRAVGNDTFALSYADSDLAAMSQSGTGTLLAPTDFTINPKLFPAPAATPTPTATATSGTQGGAGSDATPPPIEPVLPTSETILDWNYTVKGLAWPLDATVVGKDLTTFDENHLKTTILSSANVSYDTAGYTPGASATVDDHRVLVADDTVSRLFRSAVLAPNTLAWQQAMAELSASLAVITKQRPNEARTLFATLGRNYPTNAYRLADTLAALGSIPWLVGSSLSDALRTTPVDAAIVNKPEKAARISQVKALLGTEGTVNSFSSVLKDPALLTGPQRLDLLATLSNGWVADADGWKSAYSHYIKAAAAITRSVTIVESSAIIQPSDKISLPVTVRNDLEFPVVVVVTVRSPSGILHVVQNRVPLTVEANSQAGARVAVQSVANGDVLLKVTLSSTSGTPISEPSFVDVNVQAQWETAITVVIGVLLLGVFGFGIWRNIAKRRKARRARSGGADDSEPDAIGPDGVPSDRAEEPRD